MLYYQELVWFYGIFFKGKFCQDRFSAIGPLLGELYNACTFMIKIETVFRSNILNIVIKILHIRARSSLLIAGAWPGSFLGGGGGLSDCFREMLASRRETGTHQ